MSNKVTEVIYQTANGGSAKGYIIDGKTYKDPYGQTRVDVGSTVPTAGGTYTLTASGGVKTPSSVANDLSKAYGNGKANLTAAKNSAINGIKAATQRTYDTIKDQREEAKERYEDSNRAAYQAYVNASNPYGAAAEQQAKIGLADSGYSETSKLHTANTYQKALSDNALAKDAYMKELDIAYRNAKAEGDIQLANAIAEYEKLVYQHGISVAEAIARQENTAYTQGISANKDLWERQEKENEARKEAEKASYEKKERMWEKAVTLAKMGVSNRQIAEILGISLAELYRITER